MEENRFDYVPSTVTASRSVFRYNKPHSASYYLGYLYPIGAPEAVLPGDTWSLDCAGEIRSQPLIAPLMDDIHCDVFAFFIRNKDVWEHWKQFLGATDDVLFTNLTTYSIPSFPYGTPADLTASGMGAFYWNQLIACHFGLPYPGAGTVSSAANCPEISALPFRGYTFIWNEFFRFESVIPPYLFSKGDTGLAGQNMISVATGASIAGASGYIPAPDDGTVIASATLSDGGAILPVKRFNNLYTTCLPTPNLGTYGEFSALEGFAPVGVMVTNSTWSASDPFTYAGSAAPFGIIKTPDSGGVGTFLPAEQFWGTGKYGEFVADVSKVNVVLNKFREGVLLGKMYEALNRAGSRYDEILRNLWHTQTNPGVIGIPELLVHKHFSIHRNQVIATAETLDSSNNVNTSVGSQKAYIDTIVRDSLFTKSFTEHGYIHLMTTFRAGVIRHSQGIQPDFQKLTRFELYYPQFTGLGDVARYKRELFWNWSATRASQNDKVFGYQEYGAEYKSQVGRATGWTDPYVPNSLSYYTLADKISSAPSLGLAYLYSAVIDNNNFARCLSIPSPWVAPQFIVDWRITGKVAREMPVYNIPGIGGVL